MNGSTDRLEQTIHEIASTFLSESELAKKYWSEMVLTANYLRNQLPVIG